VRVAKGISQERLAFDAGVDRSYLGGMERGEANPTVDVLDRLALTLGIPLAALFEEFEKGAPAPQGLSPGRKPS